MRIEQKLNLKKKCKIIQEQSSNSTDKILKRNEMNERKKKKEMKPKHNSIYSKIICRIEIIK